MFILTIVLFVLGMSMLIDRSKRLQWLGIVLLLASFVAMMVAYDHG